MGIVTKIAHVETTSAIWEFDPTLPENKVLSSSSLDVVATIRTLAIKIQASGQRLAYFERLQLECGVEVPLKIPLHSNIRWGTADGMLSQSYNLRTVRFYVSLSFLTLTLSIGYQFIYQLCGRAFRPNHDNQAPRSTREENSMDGIRDQGVRLGTRQ
jgi:hypothetical protein